MHTLKIKLAIFSLLLAFNASSLFAAGQPHFPKLKELTVGNTVESLDDSFFKDCTELESVFFGSNLKNIGDSVFFGCTSLTEVITSPYLETIGAAAFAGNSSLSSIAMGANIRSIGENAFNGCPALDVKITAQTPPEAFDNTFSNYSGRLYLQGEQAVEDYYDAYTCWDRFDGYPMIEAITIYLDDQSAISVKAGDIFQFHARVLPDYATLPYLFWHSTNPKIATVDNFGVVKVLADIEDISTLAEDENNAVERGCKIIAETMYVNGPIVEFDLMDISTGIEEVTAEGEESFDAAIDYNAPVEVYNLNGLMMGTSMENLPAGIYIIRQGKKVEKIVVK